MYPYRTTALHLLCAIYLVFMAACAREALSNSLW